MRSGWRYHAACAGMDTSVFFVETSGTTEKGTAAKRRAVNICLRCVVREKCLEEHVNEPFGIWGAMDALERKELQRAQEESRQAGS